MIVHGQGPGATVGDVDIDVPHQHVPSRTVGVTAVQEGIVDIIVRALVDAVEEVACAVKMDVPFVAGFGLRQFHAKLLNTLGVRPDKGIDETCSTAEGVNEAVTVV